MTELETKKKEGGKEGRKEGRKELGKRGRRHEEGEKLGKMEEGRTEEIRKEEEDGRTQQRNW